MINYWLIVAGSLLFLALLVHMFVGDKEYYHLNPKGRHTGQKDQTHQDDKAFDAWLLGRAVFHMASVDLLACATALFLMGINVIPYTYWLSLFIALLHGGYLVFWLATLMISRAKPIDYLKQAQWLLFLITCLLIVMGMTP